MLQLHHPLISLKCPQNAVLHLSERNYCYLSLVISKNNTFKGIQNTIFLMELQHQTEFSQSLLANHCTACLNMVSSLPSTCVRIVFPVTIISFFVKLTNSRNDILWNDHCPSSERVINFTLNINTVSDDTSLGFCTMQWRNVPTFWSNVLSILRVTELV